MLRQKLVPLLVACALVIPLTVMTAGTAAASCNPGRSPDGNYYWAGASVTPGGTVSGIQSYINNYDPYVPYGGFSYAWVYLGGGPGSNWAQIGNYKSYNSRNIVIQVHNSVDGTRNFNFAAKAAGTWSTYQINYGAGNTFSFYVNGSGYLTQSRAWTPNFANWAAEIWQLSSQMMGGVSNQQFLSYNKLLYNGSWQSNWVSPWLSRTGSGSPPSTYFGLSGTAFSFYTWDKSCAS